MSERNLKRKEQERRVAAEGRLPPGQSLTQKFPVLHYGSVPGFDPGTWDFRIWGEVEEEVYWSWEAFCKLPRTRLVMDVHCVTRWSKFDTEWEGVSVRTLVENGYIKPKASAKFVLQHAENDYTTNLPWEIIFSDNFLLATHFDGQPITPDHGYPVRGVIGHILGREDLTVPYFWKGAKWLRGLEFMTEDQLGFWEQAGYHNEGDAWKEQRFARDA